MYWNFGEKLAVPGVSGMDFSPSAPMRGDNTAKLQVTVYALAGGATSLSIDLEGSNDRQNWSLLQTYSGLGLGYNQPAATTSIPFAFVRLKYTAVGGGPVIAGVALCTEFF